MEDMLLNAEFIGVVMELESWLKKLCRTRAMRLRSNVIGEDDLRSEAIDKLWEKTIGDPIKLKNPAWCKTVMHNAIKDTCKSEMRKKKTEHAYRSTLHEVD